MFLSDKGVNDHYVNPITRTKKSVVNYVNNVVAMFVDKSEPFKNYDYRHRHLIRSSIMMGSGNTLQVVKFLVRYSSYQLCRANNESIFIIWN